MLQPRHQLGGALGVEAADGDFAVLRLADLAQALGADLWNHRRRKVPGFFARHQGHDLGNHFAALLDEDAMAHLQAEPRQLVGIVQRGPTDRGPRHFHRLQFRHRREFAAAAHLPRDTQHRGRHLRRRIFESDGPTRHAIRGTQALLQSGIEDLQHHAIRVEGQPEAGIGLQGDEGQHSVQVAFPAGRHHAESPRPKAGHGVDVVVARAFAPQGLPGQEGQAPGGHLPAVQQLHGAAGGVAGIGEPEFSPGIPLAIQFLPAFAGEEDFASHLQAPRGVPRQHQRDVRDGPGVLGHQFARLAIAPGDGLHQLLALVDQRKR